MTQAQPAGYQQLLEENAPDLAAMVGGARASITEAGALPAHVKTLMMMMSVYGPPGTKVLSYGLATASIVRAQLRVCSG